MIVSSMALAHGTQRTPELQAVSAATARGHVLAGRVPPHGVDAAQQAPRERARPACRQLERHVRPLCGLPLRAHVLHGDTMLACRGGYLHVPVGKRGLRYASPGGSAEVRARPRAAPPELPQPGG